MFRRLSTFVAFVAALHMLGGHWAALQGAAWVVMVANFAQSEPLGEAIEKTFDGEHPCRVCTGVRKGRAEERQQEAMKTVLKMEAVLAPGAVAPAPRRARWHFPAFTERVVSRLLSPPTPPPLAA